MQRISLLNVVGLSNSLIDERMPRIRAYAENRGQQSFAPAFPAVTCTAQSSMLTGLPPSEHGIVGNGWYDREFAEICFWKQSNRLVRGKKIWEVAKEKNPDFTCANLFWWYNMATKADYAMTPRPLYPADGRKVLDIHSKPMDWRFSVQQDLGKFPFHAFWGPAAGISASAWIAEAAKWAERKVRPTLSLVYLPHLDYCLQKEGPDGSGIEAELGKIDEVVGGLLDFYEKHGVRVIIASEYGIGSAGRSIAINRELRKKGWLQVKDELGRETLDVFGSEVIAVADHQVAHVYSANGPTAELREFLENIPGVAEVREAIEPERSGDFILVAEKDAWFNYYFWEDDDKAPDFARTVDIHRKAGYDPVEMFIDPEIRFPKLKIAAFLLKKKLGLRGLLDVIPLDASLVKGTHGRDQVPRELQPIIIGATGIVNRAEDVFFEILQALEL